MTTNEMNRAADAVEQISVDTEAVVVAIKKGNGQIVIYNIGERAGREQLYHYLQLLSHPSIERTMVTLRKEAEA